MSEPNVRVVKLGGSLLELPGLADALRRWFAAQSAACNVIVVGGGRLANVVRDYDRLHRLSQTDAHWLAVRAMELNSRIVASLLPESPWLDSLGQCEEAVAPWAILNPLIFMRKHPHPRPLPATWSVTSDSIAARVAELLHAGELVLLKSILPPEPATIETAVAAGYVDAFFSEAGRRLPRIRCVNLRDRSLRDVSILTQGGTEPRGLDTL